MVERPDVPEAMVRRIGALMARFPDCHEKSAWVGTRWRVGGATVAHVFGGEDQLFRITFRAEPDEVRALEHLGAPYFRADWGRNVVGILLDERTDWEELAELLTDSYCLQAPATLAARVARPELR
jgi:predicted DNA-binding protein (MmcQ/YjbR family)